jgi:uncharacterized protein YjbI with pentapeptide repeats
MTDITINLPKDIKNIIAQYKFGWNSINNNNNNDMFVGLNLNKDIRKIQGIYYNDCKFIDCIFDECTFQNTAFIDCVFQNCTFKSVNMLSDTLIRACDFIGCIFTGIISIFTEWSVFRKCNFHKLRLCGTIENLTFDNCNSCNVTMDTNINKNCIMDNCHLECINFMNTVSGNTFNNCEVKKMGIFNKACIIFNECDITAFNVMSSKNNKIIMKNCNVLFNNSGLRIISS